MHKNISGTMFYSLLFAMGGAPTIAMMIIRSQIVDESVVYQVFMGLSIMIACVLVPVILIQNAYLFVKRKDVKLENKLKPWSQTYLVLNIFCLIFWISYQFVY
jgi:low affinity Fe/Cu permease